MPRGFPRGSLIPIPDALPSTRHIELLAPARNLACGIAAIDHGADAVYIGAGNFGARSAAGNAIADIELLATYAHKYGAKLYATVNTVVFDSEMQAALQTVRDVVNAGADAILIQDMGLLSLLTDTDLYDSRRRRYAQVHASTQTDNRTAQKAGWLHGIGCTRVVLARETSISEIAGIHAAVPDVELEAFVHGALCVSLSGQCYASQLACRRSANRGECAQMCRMQYSLLDADDKPVAPKACYLSLKDQAQLHNLERLILAGVTSLKIEGRLKDLAYVKNVTAAYSRELDNVLQRLNSRTATGTQHTHYRRASWGHVQLAFTPDLRRSFNRGYTTYFADGRQPAQASLLTPKAIGENVGRVKEIRRGSHPLVIVSGTAAFTNGDGLCFFDDARNMQGFRVNTASGNHLTPHVLPPSLRPGMTLYRSQDMAFDRLMAGKTATRTIPLHIRLRDAANRLTLSLTPLHPDGTPLRPAVTHSIPLTRREEAQQPQAANIRKQLSRLGQTCYAASAVTLDATLDSLFIPSSTLAAMRRAAVESLTAAMQHVEPQPLPAGRPFLTPAAHPAAPPSTPLHTVFTYLHNAANSHARQFYSDRGVTDATAFETQAPDTLPADSDGRLLVMQCRYCLRHEMGWCPRHGGRDPHLRMPLTLALDNGTRFTLHFDCRNCQMLVYYTPNQQ